MTDFYAQLEQQLVAAGRRRQERGRRRGRGALAGRRRWLLAGAATAAAIAGAAAAGPLRDDGRVSGPAAPATPLSPPSPRATISPSVRVAVLNGTTQSGVARRVAEELSSRGATIHTLGNFRDQQVARTVVLHRPGARASALAVATALGIDRGLVGADGIGAIDGEADVAVVVGADRTP